MSRKAVLFLRHQLHSSPLAQIAIIAVFWFAGEAAVRLVGLPLPGGVVGMGLVLVLLALGWLRPASMRRGARWLIAEMLLFFVPAVLALLDHREFLGLLGLKIIAVIVAGTVAVMCATALAVDIGYRLMLSRGGRHELRH